MEGKCDDTAYCEIALRSNLFNISRTNMPTGRNTQSSNGPLRSRIVEDPMIEEHKLRVFEKRVLPAIFGPIRGEVT